MIVDPLGPITVKMGYRVAEDSDGNDLYFHGRKLYMNVINCPSCGKELDESGMDRWNYCPFCGSRIKWH